MAADYRLWARDPKELFLTNVEGTRVLMEEARRAGTSRIVYTSSVATLKPRPDGSPQANSTAAAKRMRSAPTNAARSAPNMLVREMAADGLPVVIVNPSTPVGPRDIRPTPTGRLIVEAARGRMPAYVDTGLNMVHVEDVAEGHLAALRHGRCGEIYVLGGQDVLLRDLLMAIASQSGHHGPLFRVPRGLVYPVAFASEVTARLTGREPLTTLDGLKMSRQHMFFSSAKATRELGYRPRPYQEGLREALQWFREAGYISGAARRALAGIADSGKVSRTADHVGIDQGREFVAIPVSLRRAVEAVRRGRVEIDLVQAFGQMIEQAGQAGCGHPPGPPEAEKCVRHAQTRPDRATAQGHCPRPHDHHGRRRADRLDRRDRPGGLDRQTDGTHPVFGADCKDLPRDTRMHVEMPVRVDVVELQPGLVKSRELRRDLLAILPPRSGAERMVEGCGADRQEAAVGRDQTANDLPRQQRQSVDQDQVQAHPQLGHSLGEPDRMRDRRSGHHQARGAENTCAMCQFHGFVDFHRKPEVIGRDDQLSQCRLSRLSRRNAKNSPASRMRRLNMSGLRAISQVISAIFGARK